MVLRYSDLFISDLLCLLLHQEEDFLNDFGSSKASFSSPRGRQMGWSFSEPTVRFAELPDEWTSLMQASQ